MKSLTPVLFSVILFAFFLDSGRAFSNPKISEMDFDYRMFRSQVVHGSPAFFGPKIKGGLAGWETGLFHPRFSLYCSVRYFNGIKDSESRIIDSNIPRNVRFEIQPRFWPQAALWGWFFAPLLNVYHSGEVSGGLVAGYQVFVSKRLGLSVFGGIQTATRVEQMYASPVFPRLGVNFCVYFKTKGNTYAN